MHAAAIISLFAVVATASPLVGRQNRDTYPKYVEPKAQCASNCSMFEGTWHQCASMQKEGESPYECGAFCKGNGIVSCVMCNAANDDRTASLEDDVAFAYSVYYSALFDKCAWGGQSNPVWSHIGKPNGTDEAAAAGFVPTAGHPRPDGNGTVTRNSTGANDTHNSTVTSGDKANSTANITTGAGNGTTTGKKDSGASSVMIPAAALLVASVAGLLVL